MLSRDDESGEHTVRILYMYVQVCLDKPNLYKLLSRQKLENELYRAGLQVALKLGLCIVWHTCVSQRERFIETYLYRFVT